MADNNGWIKLYRSLIDWEWYQDATVMRVYIHLMLSASSKPIKYKGIDIPRGGLVITYRKLAADLGVSVDAAHRAMQKLKKTGEIVVTPNATNTIVVLSQYDTYQQSPNASRKQTEQSPSASRTPLYIEQEYKNKRRKNNNSPAAENGTTTEQGGRRLERRF